MKKLIKKIIKAVMPKSYIYIYIYRSILNSKKRYKKIEKEISKEYKERFHRDLNWDNPNSYTEKLNVSKVYCGNELKTQLTDKILVKDWIKEKIGEKYLIKTLGIYDSFEKIDFDSLPDRFVIKCNHDSGSTSVIEDKNNINYKELRNKYNFYLKRNFAYDKYEMHYKNIEPKIIIEENMR